MSFLKDIFQFLIVLTLLFAPVFHVQGQSAEQTFSGELILRAFQNCFPNRIGAIAFQDNDWTIQAGDETFYWAGGRLLPAPEKDQTSVYSPHVFEIYPNAVPSPDQYSVQYIEALRRRGAGEARKKWEDQHRGFQAALFDGLERREIESRLVRLEFLGRRITVHQDIAEALRRIDRTIRQSADDAQPNIASSELAAFIASIGQIGGYNWREIRGTHRMSHHSWGLAIDIQPAKLGTKSIYWLWERGRNKDWMLVPLENRWKPPEMVIKAFEQEGFIWGGKWPLYDNMHFEYRPELHEFNRLVAGDSGNNSSVNMPPKQDLHHIYPEDLLGQ